MLIYPLRPNRISVVTCKYKTNIVEFENGVEQRFPRWFKPKLEFNLEHILNNMQIDILVDFFKKTKGSYSKFIFQNHHDNNTYYVRFKDDSINIERINSKFAKVTVGLIEC